MPRSTIAQRYGQIFDVLLSLYPYATPAVAATTTSTPIAFDATKVLSFGTLVSFAAVTGYVAGTAYWSIAIQASATQGGTYTTVASIDLGAGPRERVIALNGPGVSGIVPDAKWFRVVATKVGTPGNLQFGAFFTKLD